jgi:hypothetical protein
MNKKTKEKIHLVLWCLTLIFPIITFILAVISESE